MFPIFIDLHSRRCVIAGGGRVASRKCLTLSRYCEKITVVAPRVLPEIGALPVTVLRREIAFEDLDGAFLVIAATDDPELNARIVKYCNEKSILVNSATEAGGDTFSFPAVIQRGTVTIGVNSGGVPSLSKKLRERIDACIPENLAELSEELLRRRNELREECGGTELKQKMDTCTEGAVDAD